VIGLAIAIVIAVPVGLALGFNEGTYRREDIVRVWVLSRRTKVDSMLHGTVLAESRVMFEDHDGQLVDGAYFGTSNPEIVVDDLRRLGWDVVHHDGKP